jgi:hypothetical protein
MPITVKLVEFFSGQLLVVGWTTRGFLGMEGTRK